MVKAASAKNAFVPSALQLKSATKQANWVAWSLVSRLNLPAEEQHDLRQELLLELIGRLSRFNPAQGSFWTFTTVVFRHRASELARRIFLERMIYRPAPARTDQEDDDPPLDADLVDDRDTVEFRIDLERSLELLDTENLETLESLLESNPTEVSRQTGIPRSSLYLQRKELQFRLQMAGIAPPQKPVSAGVGLAA